MKGTKTMSETSYREVDAGGGNTPPAVARVGLVMIARDEAAVIVRAIESARGLCDIVTVVVDDRTTDRTVEICRELGARVFVRPFAGSLAAARNEAIDLAKDASQFLLMLDPDDTYEGQLPEPMLSDVYQVTVRDSEMAYPRALLWKSACAVRYEGIRHEYLTLPAGAKVSMAPRLTCVRKEEPEDPAKFLAHAADLESWIVQHPQDGRAMFLLGQSYRDAGRLETARRWYERRVALEDDHEQRYMAALEVAFLVEHHGRPTVEVCTGLYLRAHELGPLRAEPLFHIGCFLRDRDDVASAWHFARRASELRMPSMATIYDVEIYRWKALALLAHCSWLLGDVRTACDVFGQIGRTSPLQREWVRSQLESVQTRAPPARRPQWAMSSALPVESAS
jgi:glycosyltransferase involved in cell wall biosynthesis